VNTARGTVPPGTLALAVVMIPFLWPFAEQFNAMAHEGAHAIVGSALGFTVGGVTVDMDHAYSPDDLGPAVAGGHAPCRRHRREVAGFAVMS